MAAKIITGEKPEADAEREGPVCLSCMWKARRGAATAYRPFLQQSVRPLPSASFCGVVPGVP